jgi:hypothetical protein
VRYIVAQYRTPVYAQAYGVRAGKKWETTRAARVPHPAWSDGKAPNTTGALENVVV